MGDKKDLSNPIYAEQSRNKTALIGMYAYLMFTTTTDLTCCFIIVFFSVFIVYGDIKFSVAIGASALLINGALLMHKHTIGTLDAQSITNGEIMIMCIFPTCLFACLSMRKIFKINNANFEKAEAEKNQSQKLLTSVLELTQYISENITVAGKETDILKVTCAVCRS